ncbi:MAG: lactate racemase domain-containing protein, partial [Thermoanaerobacterium sp.]|nr:lactate racemase domain-containing protein [Thermoanaerobacterium sp.]
MGYKEISLKYGKGAVDVKIDENMSTVLYPEDLPGVEEPMVEVSKSLKNPIGKVPLSDLVKGKKDVVILASDITRPSPSHILIPPIIDELNNAGISDDSIKIVFGLGYH